ncbi:hypothetical protein L1987_45758 [Smallanthus sonchifolius]|uniref:Uncharacterized protein n=1 Tax=Smallanthus sonchifolius TaxID=185202 RepID=A0ACB9FYW1_9ASTR|nr:hypothetical protein L1987_45758 [Smallanthus sonchifolius]
MSRGTVMSLECDESPDEGNPDEGDCNEPKSHSSLTCYSSLTCDSSSSSSTWVHRCLRADLERTLGSSKRSSYLLKCRKN